MATGLQVSFEKTGNFLFKYRGQVPLFFVLIAMPWIFFGQQNTPICSPCVDALILEASILLSVVGFAIRAYTIGTTPRGTSGRNTQQQIANQLNTNGIYSAVRHPLYLGNYLMWAGVLLFSHNLSLFICISLLYWIYYERIMFAEEKYLEKQFGEHFFQWANQVPAFIPSLKKIKKSSLPFSFKAVFRREYASFFSICSVFCLTDLWKEFCYCYWQGFSSGFQFQWLRPSLYIFLIALLICLFLSTLKHFTSLLDPEPNRD